MYRISTEIRKVSYYYDSYLELLSDGVVDALAEIETREDLRNFVKSIFPGSTISFGVHHPYIKVAGVRQYVDKLEKITIKLVNGSEDIAWFLFYCFSVMFENKDTFDGLVVRTVKLSITEKVEKKVAVTEETFVDVLVKLGFNARWADSTNNLYRYYMMKAIIVKEGNTYLVYNFNRGHGYIKTLSEKGKNASEVGSVTDILGQPQIVFDGF